MARDRQIVEELLSLCGVHLNGDNSWDPQVRDERLYTWILRDKNLGLGEA